MQIHVGTSGYSYKEWKGTFYPEDIAAGDMLACYAGRLSAVEINNTFYRMPKASVLETWAAAVPDHFRFVIKASKRITHIKRLKEVDDDLGYLCDTIGTLGPKLGALLFQLPPNFKQDLERLRRLLEGVPPGLRVALEFRHDSWADDAVHALLREHGAALCLADTDDAEPALVQTAAWGYLRLRRAEYTPEELTTWRAKLAETDWNEAFVFFKHEDDAGGPELARAFVSASD